MLCYDIADPRRLARVHDVARTFGQSLQYSVYLIVGTKEDIEAMVKQLEAEIEADEDDIRIYPLRRPVEFVIVGRASVDGVTVVDADVEVRYVDWNGGAEDEGDCDNSVG